MPLNDSLWPTLQDALDAIEASDWTDVQKRDCRSAVSSFCKLFEVAPAEVPAAASRIRAKLQTLSPQALGISKGRWANIRSGLGKAIGLVGKSYPGRSKAPLLPEWQERLDALPAKIRYKLTAGTRYLSTMGVHPGEVALEHLYAFRDTIFNDRLRARPEQVWDLFLWGWNAAMKQSPDLWPQLTIPRVDKRDVYILPFCHFPASFEADVQAYGVRLANVDLDDDGPVRPARPATIKTRTTQLRVAASALVHFGLDPALITSCAVLVEVENFKAILHFLMQRAGGKTSPQVAHIASCLCVVARYWVKVDDAHYAKLQRITRKVAVPTGGMTAKNRERLRPFDDPELVAQFLALPEALRRHVDRRKASSRRAPVLAQVAAAIALLQAIPIRVANLASIDIHRHLKQVRQHVYLVIPESETKNRQPINFKIPDHALDILRWYIRDYRQQAMRVPTYALFPGRDGGHKTTNTLSLQIQAAIFQFTGLAFNVHLFRHFAGKAFLDQQPGAYEVVRQVLGHKRIDTTTGFYSGSETQRAHEHFSQVIDSLRSEHAGGHRGRRRRAA